MLLSQIVLALSSSIGAVGLFVLLQDPRRPLYRLFAIKTVSLLLLVGGALGRSFAGPGDAAWVRVTTFSMQAGLLFSCPLILLFAERFLDVRIRGIIWFRRGLWALCPILLAAFLSDALRGTELIVRLEYHERLGWQAVRYGSFGLAHSAIMLVSLPLSAVLVLAHYPRSTGPKRAQIQYYGIGFAFAVALSVPSIFLKSAPLPALGITFWYAMIGYAITRYQFLDIRVVVRLGAVYGTVSAILLGIYAGLVAAGTMLFGWFLPADSLAVPLTGIAAVALLFDPLRDRVRFVLDRAFFRQQVDIAAALESLSGSIGRVGRVAELERLLTDTFVPALHPESFRLFVRHDSDGPDGKPAYRTLPTAREEAAAGADEDLVTWCAAEKRPCLRDAIRWETERVRPAPDPEAGPRLRRLLDALERDRMDVVVPLLRESKLTGLLALGPKRAQIPYRPSEIKFVSAVAAQAALALQNIRLNEAARALEKDRHEADKRAALGVIASEIAHEVRNPLSVIKTYVRLLPEKGQDPAFLLRFQERASPELDRVEGILNNILAGVSGQRQVSDVVRLGVVADAVLDFFAEEMARRRITAERDWNGSVPPLTGDPGQLRQVFHNLIQNAIQAMPDGGRLRVRIASVPDAVRIEVADTGPGIMPERLPKLFRPFATTKPGGTGLGLAISQRIIQEHGGSIRVESRPGEGATFFIELPRDEG